MDRADERERRIRELEGRLSRLSRPACASPRTLDFATVLQGVLDSARSLSGARYGAITVVDDSLGLQDSGAHPRGPREAAGARSRTSRGRPTPWASWPSTTPGAG